jgi:hypothetical protein
VGGNEALSLKARLGREYRVINPGEMVSRRMAKCIEVAARNQ